MFKTNIDHDLVIESSDEEFEEEEEDEDVDDVEHFEDEIETHDNTVIELPKIPSQSNNNHVVSNNSNSLSILSFFSIAKCFIMSKKFLLPTIFLGALYFFYFKQRRWKYYKNQMNLISNNWL